MHLLSRCQAFQIAPCIPNRNNGSIWLQQPYNGIEPALPFSVFHYTFIARICDCFVCLTGVVLRRYLFLFDWWVFMYLSLSRAVHTSLRRLFKSWHPQHLYLAS